MASQMRVQAGCPPSKAPLFRDSRGHAVTSLGHQDAACHGGQSLRARPGPRRGRVSIQQGSEETKGTVPAPVLPIQAQFELGPRARLFLEVPCEL